MFITKKVDDGAAEDRGCKWHSVAEKKLLSQKLLHMMIHDYLCSAVLRHAARHTTLVKDFLC